MRRCLELAARGAGRASPNPMVGSVLVGPAREVLGEGWHERFGEAHAERNALSDAERAHPGRSFEDATLYVNLEPCNHHGKTPPCTDIILEKRIQRVIVGMIDPFPAVSGSGIARLRSHGVSVCLGVLEAECRQFNEAFVHRVQTGRPLVTLKIAQTLDGRIAAASGDACWVSGETSRALVHRWRAELDAVLVGAGTAAADDPALTVRHVSGRQPVRVVLDRTGSLPPSLQLFTDAHVASTVAVIGPGARPAYAAALRAAGGRLVVVDEAAGHLDLRTVLDRLGSEGGPGGRRMNTVLVEAGPGLASALLEQDLVDRLAVFIAPKIIGDGAPSFALPGIPRMTDAIRFSEYHWEPSGEDMLFLGYRRL